MGLVSRSHTCAIYWAMATLWQTCGMCIAWYCEPGWGLVSIRMKQGGHVDEAWADIKYMPLALPGALVCH